MVGVPERLNWRAAFSSSRTREAVAPLIERHFVPLPAKQIPPHSWQQARACPAGEQVLRTMGEAHTSVIIERLKRKFGAAIATHTPRVPYKETIRGTTKVHGRYKKQTGGHGMFGDVWLELEPNPDGGVEFAEQHQVVEIFRLL